MKLMTEKLRKEFQKTGSQDHLGFEAKALAKFFSPWSNWTWYATEFDEATGEFFGYVEGLEKELGFFSLDDFERVNGQHGLIIERDMYWTPRTLTEIIG